jgi:hypothetical protein
MTSVGVKFERGPGLVGGLILPSKPESQAHFVEGWAAVMSASW